MKLKLLHIPEKYNSDYTFKTTVTKINSNINNENEIVQIKIIGTNITINQSNIKEMNKIPQQ